MTTQRQFTPYEMAVVLPLFITALHTYILPVNIVHINYLSLTCTNRFHGVVVSTPDFESGDLGSNPGGTFFLVIFVSDYAPVFRLS